MTSVFISKALDGATSFSCNKILRNTCKCLCYSQSSWRDFFSCKGGKVETPGGYTCLFVVSCVLESKQVICCPIYHWLEVSRDCPPTSDILGNKSLVTALQPVIYWATNHCKQESIFLIIKTSKTRMYTRNTFSESMKRKPSKECYMKKKLTISHCIVRQNLTEHLPGTCNLYFQRSVSP